MSNMGFSNVEVTQSLTNLVLATKSGSDAVVDESAAADLARYSHISLSAATNQLIKGSQGQARALKTLALEGLIPVINNEKAMAAAHAAVSTAQDALTTNTNSLTNAQDAYAAAVAEYGPDSAEAEKADRSLQDAQISHQDAVDKLSTANTNLKNKQKDLADPTWQMSQLTDELKTKIGGLAQAQSQTLGGAFDIVKAKVENFVGSAGQDAENWFVKNQGTIMKVAGILLGPLFTAFTAIGGAIGDVVNTLTKFYDKNKTIIDDIFNVLVTIIGTILVGVFKALGLEVQVMVDAWVILFNIAMDAIQVVINIIESIVGVVETVVGAVESFFGGLVQNIENLGTNIWNAVTSPFETAWTWLSNNVFNPIGDFFSGLGSAISSTIGGVIGAIESPFKTAFDWIAHAWNDSIGAVSFTIPSWVPFIGNDKFSMPKMPILDTGAMVTGSGLAYLHASEVIVNPQQQAEAMSGLMGGGSGAGGSGNVQLIFTGNYLLSNNAMTQFAQQVEQIVVTKLLPAGGRMVTL
jgi:phage-related protein